MSRSAVLLLGLAACAAEEVPADAPAVEPVTTFLLSVTWMPDWVPPTGSPTIYIDGFPTAYYFGSPAVPGEAHVVELRYGERVIRSRTFALGDPIDCGPSTTHLDEHIAAYRSGDLRFQGGAGFRGDGDSHCVIEWEGVPCIWGCAPSELRELAGIPDNGQRCESVVTSRSPLASHLACGPIGPKHENETCSLEQRGDAWHDDCGADLVCLDGVCRRWTMSLNPGSDTSCSGVSGYAPEMRLCPAGAVP